VRDFTRHLGHLPRSGRRLVAFLGGTIGTFYVEERAAFLGALHDSLEPGDWFLLGTDLVRSADRLIRAYDDSRGVTAALVTNCLRVLNRQLGPPGSASSARGPTTTATSRSPWSAATRDETDALSGAGQASSSSVSVSTHHCSTSSTDHPRSWVAMSKVWIEHTVA
jgi:hypothetical protein